MPSFKHISPRNQLSCRHRSECRRKLSFKNPPLSDSQSCAFGTCGSLIKDPLPKTFWCTAETQPPHSQRLFVCLNNQANNDLALPLELQTTCLHVQSDLIKRHSHFWNRLIALLLIFQQSDIYNRLKPERCSQCETGYECVCVCLVGHIFFSGRF